MEYYPLTRGVMAWHVILALTYDNGMSIGSGARREGGNEAKKIGVRTDEWMVFLDHLSKMILDIQSGRAGLAPW